LPTNTQTVTAQTPTSIAGDVEEAGLFFNAFGFTTDFNIHSVPFREVSWGGQPKDGIPAIDDPKYQSLSEGDQWLQDQEAILLLEFNGDVRADPIQILIWHELVNDVVGNMPVSVSYCPLATQPSSSIQLLRTEECWISARQAICGIAILSCMTAR
jgi:hypothetical protein